MDSKKASGVDGMSIKDLKIIYESDYGKEFSKLIVNEINNGIEENLKMGIMTLTYKKGDTKILSNFRGVMIIPVIGRLILKVNSRINLLKTTNNGSIYINMGLCKIEELTITEI
jgi:hypothetical protein